MSAAKTIAVGDSIPDVKLHYVPYVKDEPVGACGRPIAYSVHKEWKGKKVILFAVPGAFTPSCSETHLPGFVSKASTILGKADLICGISTNDAFVLSAWGKVNKVEDKITLIADGNAEFVRALGLTQDLTAMGLSIRSKRFALIADDLKVTWIGVEPGADVKISSAEEVISHL